MGWDYYVRRDDRGALDPAVAGEFEDGLPGWETLVAEVHVSRDTVAAGVHFDAESSELQRAEYADLLGRLVTLAERLGARVWDPQRETYLTRADVDPVAAGLP